MTHWPAFMVASSKFRSCFSEYLTPMSTLLCSPFVLAWRGGGLGVSVSGSRDPCPLHLQHNPSGVSVQQALMAPSLPVVQAKN